MPDGTLRGQQALNTLITKGRAVKYLLLAKVEQPYRQQIKSGNLLFNSENDTKEVKFIGRRIRTKFYQTGNSLLIHADVNGSLKFYVN